MHFKQTCKGENLWPYFDREATGPRSHGDLILLPDVRLSTGVRLGCAFLSAAAAVGIVAAVEAVLVLLPPD